MRFAVRWLARRQASPRSHGTSCRDVPCRVHVSVAGISAGRAGEGGLTLARLRIHLPARRAALARERRIDLFDPAGSLVFQAADQQAPCTGEDRSVQPCLLPDVAARLPDGAARGARHVADLQILNADHIEPPGQSGRGLLSPISAAISLAGPQLRDGQLDALPVPGALPCPGQAPLQPQQPFPLAVAQAEHGEKFAGRQGRGDGYAPVDADDLARPGPAVGSGIAANAICQRPARSRLTL